MEKPKIKQILLTAIFVMTGVFLYAFFPLLAEVTLFDYYYTDQADAISELSQKIEDKKAEVENLKVRVSDYKKEIEQKQEEKITFKNYLVEIENEAAKTELEIQRIGVQKEAVDLEKEKIELQIQEKELEVSVQKERLGNFVRKIFQNDQRNYLAVLLLNDSFSEFFNQLQYLENIEASVVNIVEKVKSDKASLEVHKDTLEAKDRELAVLEVEVQRERMLLESEKEVKRILIVETERSEEKFQQLLARVKAEQSKINSEINAIEADIKKKLAEKKINFNWDPNNVSLLWPIPNQGITVYFHDPTYPYRSLVGEHSGIDIRTLINGRPSNGIPLRAAAPGLVIKVIRNGNYVGNAVYVAHSEEFMTVYLHMSRVDVKEDDVLNAGDVIGLTGGAPGSPGAGLSSGPHLHFEVRENGIPVDPLQYLP